MHSLIRSWVATINRGIGLTVFVGLLLLSYYATTESFSAPQVSWKYPLRADGPCEYHPIPADARAMVATITPASQNLKSDGMGQYWQGNDTVRSYFGSNGINWNFFTYMPEKCDAPLPRKLRFLEFHLDSPEPGATSMGVIRDETSMIHVFPQGPAIQESVLVRWSSPGAFSCAFSVTTKSIICAWEARLLTQVCREM